jgi:hypothetical protein
VFIQNYCTYETNEHTCNDIQKSIHNSCKDNHILIEFNVLVNNTFDGNVKMLCIPYDCPDEDIHNEYRPECPYKYTPVVLFRCVVTTEWEVKIMPKRIDCKDKKSNCKVHNGD